jgi:hypothetical protein
MVAFCHALWQHMGAAAHHASKLTSSQLSSTELLALPMLSREAGCTVSCAPALMGSSMRGVLAVPLDCDAGGANVKLVLLYRAPAPLGPALGALACSIERGGRGGRGGRPLAGTSPRGAMRTAPMPIASPRPASGMALVLAPACEAGGRAASALEGGAGQKERETSDEEGGTFMA